MTTNASFSSGSPYNVNTRSSSACTESQGRGQYPEIEDPRATALEKDNRTKITVASHEQASLLVSYLKQVSICCTCQTKLRDGHNIMP